MDFSLIATGAAKLLFGLFVSVIGITTAVRTMKRAIGFSDISTAILDNNVAVAATFAAAVIAVGLLVQPSVYGVFSAFELLFATAQSWTSWMWLLVYAVVHVLLSLAIGISVLIIGVQIAIRLTPSVDEVEEIRGGNIAAALVLAAVLIVLALVSRDSVQSILNGLLPMPVLGRDAFIQPF